MLGNIILKLKKELESPADDRWFGSGWLSGSGALLCHTYPLGSGRPLN